MVDRPIIFSAPMVLALLREAAEPGAGKSMTRRLLYTIRKAKNGIIPESATLLEGHPPPFDRGQFPDHAVDEYWTLSGWQRAQPGDRLWVRESHHALGSWDCRGERPRFVWANLNGHEVKFDGPAQASPRSSKVGWWTRPAIHMPRAFSRLTLVVTGMKIEHLQAISDRDATLEGIPPRGPEHPYGLGQREFADLWRRLHGADAWDANPEVIAISFKVLQTNVDMLKAA